MPGFLNYNQQFNFQLTMHKLQLNTLDIYTHKLQNTTVI